MDSGSRWHGIVVGVVLVASLLMTGSHNWAPSIANPPALVDKQVQFYPVAPDRGISTAPPTGADRYTVSAGTTEGPSGWTAWVSGAVPTPLVAQFSLAQLAQDYFLNLSQPVLGDLYLSNTPTQTATEGAESGMVRLEVWSADHRVAGVEYHFNLAQAGVFGTWMHIPFSVRAEVEKLVKGDSLSIKVAQYSGMPGFVVGTGGDHATRVEFRYFDADPMGGILYAESGKLYSSATGSSISAATPDVTGFLDTAAQAASRAPEDARGLFLFPARTPEAADGARLSGLPLIALLGLPVRRALRNRFAWAAGAILLAGCVSDPTQPSSTDPFTEPSANVETRTYEQPPERGSENGTLAGRVLDDQPVPRPVAGATVVAMHTSYVAKSDTRGGFEFGNMTPGDYEIRIDHRKYEILTTTIAILAGKVTGANFYLKPLKEIDYIGEQHQHPMWNGKPSATLYEGTFEPQPTTRTPLIPTTPLGQVPLPQFGESHEIAGTWYCVAGGAATNLARQHYCKIQVPVEAGKLVFPGTGRVEVKASWTGGAHLPPWMGLHVETAITDPDKWIGANGHVNRDQFVPRGQNDPFTIAVFPHEADPGHMELTRWTFTLYTPITDTAGAAEDPIAAIDTITVSIKIYPTVIPFEPRHTDYWKGRDSLELAKDARIICVERDASRVFFPTPTCALRGGGWVWNETANRDEYKSRLVFIPPGTNEIRGVLSWGPVGPWGVAYKPANMSESPFDPVDAELGPAGAANVSFTIRLEKPEPDQYYMSDTEWVFYPTNAGDAVTALRTYPSIPTNNMAYRDVDGLRFSISVYRDPSFDPKLG